MNMLPNHRAADAGDAVPESQLSADFPGERGGVSPPAGDAVPVSHLSGDGAARTLPSRVGQPRTTLGQTSRPREKKRRRKKRLLPIQDGRTIIMVTHDRELAEHAQRVIVLDDGQIAEDRAVSQPRDAEAELAALVPTEENET